MAVKTLHFTSNSTKTINLSLERTSGFFEIAAEGDFGGGSVAIKRRITGAVSDMPCLKSWADLTAVTINQELAGLTLKEISPEDSLVFTLSGATAPDFKIYLIGFATGGVL